MTPLTPSDFRVYDAETGRPGPELEVGDGVNETELTFTPSNAFAPDFAACLNSNSSACERMTFHV